MAGRAASGAQAQSLGKFVSTHPGHLHSMLRVAPISSGDSVLDIGSGDGAFLKQLFAETGCRGVGVESCPRLHELALRTCAQEIEASSLRFLHMAAEKLEADGQHVHYDDVHEKVTYVYLYLVQELLAACPPLLGVLAQLLAAGACIITNTFELPLQVFACRSASWPPDIETLEGMMEHLSRASGDASTGTFYVYRRPHYAGPLYIGAPKDTSSVLARLHNEPYCKELQRRVAARLLVVAETGRWTLAQRRSLAMEWSSAHQLDLASFAAFAGHACCRPALFTRADVPRLLKDRPVGVDVDGDKPDLFEYILRTYIQAVPMLVAHAASVGLKEQETMSHTASAATRDYAALWASLARSGRRAEAAAAFAMWYPAMVVMSRRLSTALTGHRDKYTFEGPKCGAVCLLDSAAAAPVSHVLEMAAMVIEEDGGRVPYQRLREISCCMLEAIGRFFDATLSEGA